MKRIIIDLLLVLGIVFILIAPSVGAVFLFLGAAGIIILIAERKVQIQESWSILIRGAQGQRDKVISTTKELINISKAPSIEMKEEKVGPSLAPSAFGETREFLIVADRRSLKLGNFKAYVNANDYGDGLFVSWYLTYMPDVWQTLASLIPGAGKLVGLDELNLFNRQDLTAYATCVHHCLLEAVEQMMSGKGMDISKIDRKTRGFFGIS